MAKTNIKRLTMIAGGGVIAVVAIITGVFFLEYGGVTSDIPLALPTGKPLAERSAWSQPEEGRTIDLEVPPKLEAVDDRFAALRDRLVPVADAEAELERATADLTLPIYIPEQTLLDNTTYWEQYDAYITQAMDREFQRLPPSVMDEFGATLQLLKTRLATRDRSLQPDEKDRERLSDATEPLVILADTIFRRDEFTPESLILRCRESLFALLDSDTHGYLVFTGAQELLVGLRKHSIPFTETDLGLLFRAFERLSSATTTDAEEMETSFPIYLCTVRAFQTFNDLDDYAKNWFVRKTGEFVADNPEVDPYAFLCLAGERHKKIGWKARGTGWASEVPEDAWPIFQRETQLAANYNRAAYALHDDIPYAPCQLIDLAKTSDVGGSPKRWLNRTLSIQRDYYKAYSNYSYTLSPRWGGSNYLQVEFANVCIGMNDFGPGGISWECVKALRTIRNSTSIVGQSVDEIPGYTETLLTFSDAVIEAYESSARDDCDFVGMRDLLSWLSSAGELERFQHLLSFGQPDYFWTYGDWTRGVGAAYGSPSQERVMELYLDFIDDDRPVMTPERLVAWKETIEQLRAETSDDEISRFLDLCAANVSAGETYYSGDWVKLSLHDDEHAGRVNFQAGRVSYDDDDFLLLESAPNGSYTQVYVRPRLPPPMLIDSTFQPQRFPDSPYMENLGIVAGSGRSSDGVKASPKRAVYVNDISTAMGYRTFPLGQDGPLLPGGVPVAPWMYYRMGMFVTSTETRAYWYMKEIHREQIAFNEPYVQLAIRPLLNYAVERRFRVKNVFIRYCPDGELPDDYDPANSTMHEKAAKRAAGEEY